MRKADLKGNLEGLKRKHKRLRESYDGELAMIKRMVNDLDNVEAFTFEANMINHLVEMNSLKMRIVEIEEQISFLSIVDKDNAEVE